MNNILKIYLWRVLGISINFLSFLMIIPKISSMPTIYGIYSSIIYLLIFISYSDFGFISAALKFGAELIGRKDKVNEIKLIAFSAFITFLASIFASIVFFYLFLNPNAIFSNASFDETQIAKKLYLGLAIFAPFYAFKRAIQVIYQIRVNDYVYQIADIIFNITKIVSIYYFFNDSTYNIVGYFYFYNITYVLIILYLFIDIKLRYSYDWKLFFKSFRWAKAVYKQIHKYTYAMLFAQIATILITQFDITIISIIFDARLVAIFAIGLAISTYIQSLIGTIYLPFAAILNQQYGLNNHQKFDAIISNLLRIGTPLIWSFTGVVFVFSGHLILSWVGKEYTESIQITRILVATFFLSNLYYPLDEFFKANLRNKLISRISIMAPLVYYLSIFILVYLGLSLASFAYAKLITIIFSTTLYLMFFLNFKVSNLNEIFNKNGKSLIIIIPFLLIVKLIIDKYLIVEKSFHDTILVIGFGFLTTMILLLLITLSDKLFREYARNQIAKLNRIIFINTKS